MKRVLVAKVCCAMRVNGQTIELTLAGVRRRRGIQMTQKIKTISSPSILQLSSLLTQYADAPSGRVRHQHVPFTKGSFMRRHTSHTLRRWKSAHFPFISIQTFPLLILIVLDFFTSD